LTLALMEALHEALALGWHEALALMEALHEALGLGWHEALALMEALHEALGLGWHEALGLGWREALGLGLGWHKAPALMEALAGALGLEKNLAPGRVEALGPTLATANVLAEIIATMRTTTTAPLHPIGTGTRLCTILRSPPSRVAAAAAVDAFLTTLATDTTATAPFPTTTSAYPHLSDPCPNTVTVTAVTPAITHLSRAHMVEVFLY
jgi:hypothetical protein